MTDYTTSRRQKMQERLLQVMPNMVEELYNEMKPQETGPTLLQIERMVQRALKPLAREMVLELVRQLAQEQKQADEPVLCSCERPAEYEHEKPLTLLTLWDTISLERPYFSCAPCGHGTVPLDQWLRIGPGQISPALEESLSMLGACMPFAAAVRNLKKLLQVELPAKTGQRVTQRIGAELEALQQQDIQQAYEKYTFPAMEGAAPEVLYMSVDGTQTHLADGYHEAKVAVLHRAELRSNSKGEQELHAVDCTYVVAIDEPAEEFAQRVLVEGYRRGWDKANLVVVLGDGASWIWDHVSAQVPDTVEKMEIIDFYHASKYLWDLSKAVFGEESEETKAWAEARLKELRQGQMEMIIREVESLWVAAGADEERLANLGQEKAQDLPQPQKTIRETWTYFRNGQERMHYDQYRQRGLFIGSGTVESACNWLIGARLKQSNMRWSKQGAHYVMQVRALFFSDRDRWDRFWDSRHPPPRHRHFRDKAA